jgi:WD40 repeat protein
MRRPLVLTVALLALGLCWLLSAAAPFPDSLPPAVISLDPTGTSRALALAYSPDGRWLAVGTSTGLVLYDAHTQAEVRFIPSITWVRAVAFTPDSQTLAVGYYEPAVRLWRVADGTLLRTLEGHTSWVRSLVFTPDGATLLTASDDQSLRWWRVADGAPLRTLTDGMVGLRVVAIAPDGQTLATGGADGQVRLLRAADGALLRTLAGHTAWIRSLAFSPDGQTLASGAFDATARLWRVRDGAPLSELRGHTFSVLALAFTPDGSTLATGSVDATIALWRVSDGRRLRVLAGHTGIIFGLDFAPDGLTLASGAADNTVRLWPVDASWRLPQTDNAPIIPSTSCVECHHPRGDFLQPGGLTESPPVLDVACAACHADGSLVLHWCPAFPRAAGPTERHGSLDTLSNQVGFPSASRTFALALAAPGNGEHYYVPAIHTVLPVSGQLYGPATAGLTVTLEVFSGEVRTGTATTQADASGHFYFSTDLRPNGIVLEVPIEQRECVNCHSESLSAVPALAPGDVRLVVSAVSPAGETAQDVRWITVDRSRTATAAVSLVSAAAAGPLPALAPQASTRLYHWRGRTFSGLTAADGVARFNVEVLSEVAVTYSFALPPTLVAGRLYASVAPVTVTVPAGTTELPPVTLTIRSEAGQITGRLAALGGPFAVSAIHLPDGARYVSQTSSTGAFTFSDLPLGQYQLVADPDALAALGLAAAALPVDLTTMPRVDVELDTEPLGPGAFHGTVADEQGQPLPFAWVSPGQSDAAALASPATGVWAMFGAGSNIHSLVASAPGYFSQALAIADDQAGLVTFRLRPRPDLQRLPWGDGAILAPAETRLTASGLQLSLASGWLWGQGAGAQPVVIETASVVLTISGGPFALENVPGQPAWLYLLGGQAQAYRVGQPAQPVDLAANSMLALDPAAPLTAVPLDPIVFQALRPAGSPPPPVWEPTLGARLGNGLSLLGITAAQVVTFITYMAVLFALFAVPLVRLSWWLRHRRRSGRFSHV